MHALNDTKHYRGSFSHLATICGMERNMLQWISAVLRLPFDDDKHAEGKKLPQSIDTYTKDLVN
jgi:hypothetical protein